MTGAAGIQPLVDEVSDEVHQHDPECENHDDRLDDGIVAPADGAEQEPPEAGDSKDLLDDDGAGHDVGDRHGQKRHRRGDGVAQDMAVERGAAAVAAAVGRADVVALQLREDGA